MPTLERIRIDSPLGPLQISASEEGICSIDFSEQLSTTEKPRLATTQECVRQLTEYFEGKRTAFDLPLCMDGTSFEESVWKKLRAIDYGETKTYGHIAKAIGKERASRAVGGAVGRNKLAIIIPCHRIVSSQSLGGFAWGVWRKKWLLNHEKMMCAA